MVVLSPEEYRIYSHGHIGIFEDADAKLPPWIFLSDWKEAPSVLEEVRDVFYIIRVDLFDF